MPEAQWPDEDRDEVLNPAVEGGQTESRRRQMGGCCVVEDADQKVDGDEKPSFGEEDPYISGDPLVCAASGGGEPQRHLSSSSLRTLELQRNPGVGKDSAASPRPFVPFRQNADLTWQFTRIDGTSPSAALTCRTDLSPMLL